MDTLISKNLFNKCGSIFSVNRNMFSMKTPIQIILPLCLCGLIMPTNLAGTDPYRHSRQRMVEQVTRTQQNAWFEPQKNREPKKNAVRGDMLRKNAVLGASPKKSPKAKAEKPAEKEQTLNFYYDQGDRHWQPRPRKRQDPDEDLSLGGEHRIKAHADLSKSEDLDISIGPEIIIKDQKQNTTLNKTDQPDSQLGVGLRFSYDF